MKQGRPLILQIERLRQILMHLSDQRGFGDDKVIALSQKVDTLLNMYDRERREKKNVTLDG